MTTMKIRSRPTRSRRPIVPSTSRWYGGYNAGEIASGMASAFIKSELSRWLSEAGRICHRIVEVGAQWDLRR